MPKEKGLDRLVSKVREILELMSPPLRAPLFALIIAAALFAFCINKGIDSELTIIALILFTLIVLFFFIFNHIAHRSAMKDQKRRNQEMFLKMEEITEKWKSIDPEKMRLK